MSIFDNVDMWLINQTVMNYEDKLRLCMTLYPDFRIIKKGDVWLMGLIAKFLYLVTFGRTRNFMTGFVTTIHHDMYVPDDWDYWSEFSRYQILSHELVHIRQSDKYGRFLFSFLYLFTPLPIGFAWYRTMFEMEAYAESMRAVNQRHGISVLYDPEYKRRMMSHFTSAEYLWMMPFKGIVSKWYDKTVKDLEA